MLSPRRVMTYTSLMAEGAGAGTRAGWALGASPCRQGATSFAGLAVHPNLETSRAPACQPVHPGREESAGKTAPPVRLVNPHRLDQPDLRCGVVPEQCIASGHSIRAFDRQIELGVVERALSQVTLDVISGPCPHWVRDVTSGGAVDDSEPISWNGHDGSVLRVHPRDAGSIRSRYEPAPPEQCEQIVVVLAREHVQWGGRYRIGGVQESGPDLSEIDGARYDDRIPLPLAAPVRQHGRGDRADVVEPHRQRQLVRPAGPTPPPLDVGCLAHPRRRVGPARALQ